MRQVDEIMLLDIGATPERRGPDLDLISELASEVFSPLTVGGGIKTVQDVRDLLKAGADKVCINTSAVENPAIINEIAEKFGSSTLVVSIDARKIRGQYCVVTRCGTNTTAIPVSTWAREVEGRGAGEILLTSVDREGTMEGYDLNLIWSIEREIPVIASGGCGSYADMLHALDQGADAVSAGSLFQFTESTPRGASEWLAVHGVETRCG